MESIAIIGAGPPGLQTATRLKELGFEATVFEEHETIGLPENCGGLISKKGVKELGLSVEECLQNEIRGAKIFSPNGTMLKVSLPKTVAYVVDRKGFDQMLARKAREKGAKIVANSRLIDIHGQNIFLKSKERGEMKKAQYVVGADGANSTTRQLMGTTIPRENFVHSAQAVCSGNFEKEIVEIHFGDFADGFFGWMIPISNEKARIGLGCRLGKNPSENLQKFITKKFPEARSYGIKSSLIPCGAPLTGTQLQKGNMMLLGDAAFQTKATSIDYEEPILVLGEDGYIRNEKIGEIADKELTNPRNEIIASEKYELALPEREIHAFSPTKKAETNRFRRIRSVLRHRIDEDLYEIILEKGYRVKATASHSIMVATKDGFGEKYTSQLTPEKDIIALNANIPRGKVIEEINLIKEFMSTDPEFAKNIQIIGLREEIYSSYKEIEQQKRSQYWHNNCIPLTKFIKKGFLPINTKISAQNSKFAYDNIIKLTPELCRLLGYFTAEGSFKTNNLTLTFGIKDNENGYIKDAIECIKKSLGIEPETPIVKKNSVTGEPSAISITFGGIIAKKLFENVLKCGRGAINKQVPWVMFNTNNELKKEFLKGYLRGDGTIRIRKNENKRHQSIELSAKTISRKLASDLVLISLQLKLFPSIEETEGPATHTILNKQVHCKQCYKITYSRIEDINPLLEVFPQVKKSIIEFTKKRETRSTVNIPKELLSFGSSFPRQVVAEFGSSVYNGYQNLSAARLQKVLKDETSTQHEFLKNIINQGIMLLRIKEIKKVTPTSNYVYDVEIPETQMFCGGVGPILLHNTGGGIIFGMKAGNVLAQTIVDNIVHKKPLSNYDKNLEKINRELRMHWKIRKYFNSMRAEEINKLFAKLKEKGIEEFLEKEGDIDNPSKFVGKLAGKPKFWFMARTLLDIARS